MARATAQRVIPEMLQDGRLAQTGKGKKAISFRYFLPEKDSAQTTHIYGQKESLPKTLSPTPRKSLKRHRRPGHPHEAGQNPNRADSQGARHLDHRHV